jgi:hypothetical protein
MTTPQAISEFWQLFQRREAELAAAKSADSPVYDALLDQLQKIGAGLYLEFSANTAQRELIVSADGDRSLFPVARAVVAAAPDVGGWTIRALKPKLGFPMVTTWGKVELKIEELVFEPLEAEGTDDLGLLILIPGLADEDLDDAHNAVLRALDHGLGEEHLAEAVRHTEVAPLPPDEKADDYIALVELESFIEWRARRRSGKA